MSTDELFAKIKTWINFKILSNPSGQNQISDHFYPHFAVTLLLLTIPWIGIYAGLIVPAFSFYKELIEDGHWKDLFSKTESGADGRIDLFFRLAGSAIAYLTIIWRSC